MVLLIGSLCIWGANAHASMTYPAARQVKDTNTQMNDKDGLKGPRCGAKEDGSYDSYDTKAAKEFKVGESFSAGEEVDVQITFAANHQHSHAFQYACMDNKLDKSATQVSWETLKFTDGSTTNTAWCKSGGSKMSRNKGRDICTLPVRLPQKNCQHGVLNWHWGEWRNCADITITGGSSGSSVPTGSGSNTSSMQCEKSTLKDSSYSTACQKKVQDVTVHYSLDAAKTTATICIQKPNSLNWLALGSAKDMNNGFVSVSADSPGSHNVGNVYKLAGHSLPRKDNERTKNHSAKDMKDGNMRTLCVKLKKEQLLQKESTDMSKVPFAFAIGVNANFDGKHGARHTTDLDLASSVAKTDSDKGTTSTTTSSAPASPPPASPPDASPPAASPPAASPPDSGGDKDTTTPSTDSGGDKDTTTPSTDSGGDKDTTTPSTDSGSDKDTTTPSTDEADSAQLADSEEADYTFLIVALAAGGVFLLLVVFAGMSFKNKSNEVSNEVVRQSKSKPKKKKGKEVRKE
eukprot:GEMP01037320.1.p1 GENE.GEMP01037320.1~~GEMP01037320.1.p1  ORF type:complete len:517 (+),score=89.03 GEMP01037320.1:69-1619(+)